MSFTWIDGKLSRHHMAHEHPLELEEIDARERTKKDESAAPAKGATLKPKPAEE